MIYNVHYPDGSVKLHKTIFSNCLLPGIEKVFDNRDKCFIVSEMSQTDIWAEEISKAEYNLAIKSFGAEKCFIYFQYNGDGISLLEF